MRNYFKKFGKIDKVKVVHDKKKNGEEKNYAFVLFKHKDTMTKVLENGSKHDLGIEIVECKQTLLRDELKQKHLEKLQKNKEDSSEGGKKKKKRKRRKRKKKKKTKDTIETKETIEKKMGNQQVEKKKKEKTKKNPINLPQKKFKSTDDVKKIETSLHKNVNKKQNFGSSDNTFESCWMAESQNLSLNYPNNPKKSSISTPFDSDEKEDEKILPHVGESLNQSNPFLNENLKQEWNVSSIQKEKSQKFENGKHNFYPSLTDNSNFGDNFFQRLKKIGDNTEKESEDLAQNFNSGFFDSPSDEVRIEAPPQECQQRNRGHARIWKDCRLPAYENRKIKNFFQFFFNCILDRKLANFSEAPDQQPHPGFHMYRMVSFETQSELARNSDLSDSNLIQRTRSGLTRLNFSKNKNLSTDNCFNFANMSTDEKNIFGNFDPRNKEDIQRASNMANICNDDAWKRNSFDTRISGINQITKYNDTKKRVKEKFLLTKFFRRDSLIQI